MPPRNVKVIQAKPNLNTIEVPNIRKKRVAAYCRVSTELEEQQGSFNEQKRYYKTLIDNNDQWMLVDIYADKGITGTKDYKRNNFMRMIDDCRNHKIDIILTKSITRFARNTLDTLKYVKELKDLGVTVIFEKENINSTDENSKVALAILSSLAEEESRSISNNVKWAFQRKFERGSSTMGIEKLYGYNKDKDGNVIIIEEEAEYVRLIYQKYLEGWSTVQITRHLQDINAPTCQRKGIWYESTVKSILTNEKYCGDALLQKTFCEDFLTSKRKKNKGQVNSYYVENSHPGIIDKETFQLVQKERVRRVTLYYSNRNTKGSRRGRYSKYILTNLLICEECGQPYRRCSWTNYQEVRYVYRCYSRQRYGKKYCKSSFSMEEKQLKQLIVDAINETISIPEENINKIYNNLFKVVVSDNPKNVHLKHLIEDLKEKINLELKKEFPDSAVVMELTDRINELNKQKDKVDKDVLQQAKQLKQSVLQNCNRITEFDDGLVRRLITKIVVKGNRELDIYFRSNVVITKKFEKKRK